MAEILARGRQVIVRYNIDICCTIALVNNKIFFQSSENNKTRSLLISYMETMHGAITSWIMFLTVSPFTEDENASSRSLCKRSINRERISALASGNDFPTDGRGTKPKFLYRL